MALISANFANIRSDAWAKNLEVILNSLFLMSDIQVISTGFTFKIYHEFNILSSFLLSS